MEEDDALYDQRMKLGVEKANALKKKIAEAPTKMEKLSVVEHGVAKLLRDPEYLKCFDKTEVVWLTHRHKSRVTTRKMNRWIVDRFGIVAHYPTSLAVAHPRETTFKEFPLSPEDRYFKSDNCGKTSILYSTEHLVAVEFRCGLFWGCASIYNRKKNHCVLQTDEHSGHLFTGVINGITEMFIKSGPSTRTVISRITEDGDEVPVWEGDASCDCEEREGKDEQVESVYLNKQILLKLCHHCSTGRLMDLSDDSSDSSSSEEVAKKEEMRFSIAKRTCANKILVDWLDHTLVVVVGKKSHWDYIQTLSFVQRFTGLVELSYEAKYGDNCVCYEVSQSYIVVCWRNTYEAFDKFTKLMIKYRKTGKTRVIQVPDMKEDVSSVRIRADHVLVAYPSGRGAIPEINKFTEELYTLDLSAENPADTVLSITLPAIETRPYGMDYIMCRRICYDRDVYKCYSFLDPDHRRSKKPEDKK